MYLLHVTPQSLLTGEFLPALLARESLTEEGSFLLGVEVDGMMFPCVVPECLQCDCRSPGPVHPGVRDPAVPRQTDVLPGLLQGVCEGPARVLPSLSGNISAEKYCVITSSVEMGVEREVRLLTGILELNMESAGLVTELTVIEL